MTRNHELSAEADAGGARVRVAALAHRVEQERVGERWAEKLLVLVDAALAVGVRPRVVLRVERAMQGQIEAEARLEERGRRRQAERVLARVVHVDVEATVELEVEERGARPEVLQAGVELHLELEVDHVRSIRVDEIVAGFLASLCGLLAALLG